MKTEIQKLIILILGLDSTITIIGVISLIAFTSCDVNIVLALVSVITTLIGMLGGVLTAEKVLTPEEQNIETTEDIEELTESA